jgi:hypothetical protein
MRIVGLGMSVMALCASAAFAQKPPETLDAKGIDAWRLANIDADGWTLMHADGEALSYARRAAEKDPEGYLRIEVRREYYKPVRLGPMPSRSNYQTWVVDCELRRMKVVGMNFYALNNMRGDGFRKSADKASWTSIAPEAGDSPVFERICAPVSAAR